MNIKFKNKLDVVVIGAGITGISIAEFLRREGVKVTLIDPIDPGDPGQSSYGNAGLLAVSSIIPVNSPDLWYNLPKYLFKKSSPLAFKLSYLPKLLPWLIPFLKNSSKGKFLSIVNYLQELTHDSVDQHLSLSRGTGADKYLETGELAFLFKTEKEFQSNLFEMKLREKYGFYFKKLNRSQILERDSMIGPNYNYAALFPNQGWLTSPGNYINSLAKFFKKNGGKIIKDEVLDIDNQIVITKKGKKIITDKIIVAAGIWSKKILKGINHYVNLETERGYHVFLKGVNYMPPLPYIVNDLKFAITPMDEGLRFAGTVEFGGIDSPLSTKRTEYIKNGIRKIYPNLKWEREEIWMGHRPTTTDSLPVIGESKSIKNLYFAFGGQHVGITIGPKLGRITTDLILGRKPNILLTPYSHDRF